MRESLTIFQNLFFLGSLLLLPLSSGCKTGESEGSQVLDTSGRQERGATVEVLGAVSESQLASFFSTRLSSQLDRCLSFFNEPRTRPVRMVTTNVLQGLRSNYPYDGSDTSGYCYRLHDLRHVITNIFDSRSRQRAYPDDIKNWITQWAVEKVRGSIQNGRADFDRLDFVFYDDYQILFEKNAVSREQNPSGVDLKSVRSLWQNIGRDSNLDYRYINPIVLPREISIDSDEFYRFLERDFLVRRGGLVEQGVGALTSFWRADEGPNGDPRFEGIVSDFSEASIVERLYFFEAQEGYSSNVLVIIDEHRQVYGLQMGYSE